MTEVFALAITAAISAVVSAMLGFILIPWLRRLNFGQTILDIGPVWHKEKKQGTPTMGGFLFIISSVAAFIAGIVCLRQNGLLDMSPVGELYLFRAVSGLVMAVCLAFVGFLDDYLKVRRKRNDGLTPNQKLLLQIFVIAAYFTARYMSGDTSTVIKFPFIGGLDLWLFYYVIMGLGILFLVNAVNLTDGVDGLCSSVTVIYCAAFVIICALFQFPALGILGGAVAGGLIGFLFWNFHPAKVFMGDTGSMFLGGIVCALGFGAGAEILMIIASAVYIWEAVTVLIQTAYFKITHGRRLFKMTPIHHSFEMRGFKETSIVSLFSLLTLVACAVAVILVSGY